jgi:hypothetical protein
MGAGKITNAIDNLAEWLTGDREHLGVKMPRTSEPSTMPEMRS